MRVCARLEGRMGEKKMVFSHSQLETYEHCPLKYRLQYIERVRTGRQSIEAFMGSLVHNVLERLYRDLMMSRHPTLDDVRSLYLRLWKENYSEKVFVVREEYEADDYRETGLRCITDYYRRYAPFRGGVPIWLERRVNIRLKDRRGETVHFVGVLDRLDSLGGGKYEIHDYKTSGVLPTFPELARDRQLSLYQLAVEEAYPDAGRVDLVWHYLVFDKEMRLRRTREELERIASEAAELAREIESRRDYPPRESEFCEWCEVQEFCPKRKHYFMITSLTERELGADMGVRLVDEYAEWLRRKKEAEGRLRDLRGEILEFSAYHGVDNIHGTAHLLKIHRPRRLKVPRVDSPEGEELQRILREAGLWEEVSALDPRLLEKGVREGKWNESLTRRIRSFLRWEEIPTVRLQEKEE